MTITNTTNPMSVVSEVIAVSTEITTDLVYVQKVVWSGATTAGHKANITNTAGDTMFTFVADAPGASGVMMYTYDFPYYPHPCNGLACDDLDSGDLYIYTIKKPTTQAGTRRFAPD